MPKICIIFFLILPFIAVTQPILDTFYKSSSTHLTRERNINITHQLIELDFDWQKKRATGNTILQLYLLTPSDSINLDAAYLTIQKVLLKDGTTLYFKYDEGDQDDALKIKLDRIYLPNEKITIQLYFYTNHFNDSDPNNVWASNGKGLRFFTPTSTEPKKKKQLWSISDYNLNRYWYPSFDGLNDERTTEVIGTVDPDMLFLSNGILTKSRINEDGRTTYHWVMDKPIQNYQISIVAGQYKDAHQQYKDIVIHNYGYIDEHEGTTASTERLPDMMKYFSEKTQCLYPYSTYTQVFVQELPGIMNNASFSTITENMIDDYGVHQDFLYLWDAVEAEALAQQWFGGLVSYKDITHAWLSRSFSRFFANLYDEYKNGKEEFLLFNLNYEKSVYLSDFNTGVRRAIVTNNVEDPLTLTTDNYSTFRGAMVLHMLRKHLGDEMWWKVISNYLKKYAGQSCTTEDFKKNIEDTSGQPLDWFFEQWIYKIGHPTFNVVKNYDAKNKKLTLKVIQTQENVDTLSYSKNFFKGKMDIAIDNKIYPIWIYDKAQNTYEFNCNKEPLLISFDHEGTWIKEVVFSKSIDELVYQFQHDIDVLGQKWAMDELSAIFIDTSTTVEIKNKIHIAFLNVIKSDAYWRTKFNAIGQLRSLIDPNFSNEVVSLDKITIQTLLEVIQKEKSWNRSASINLLGLTRDSTYADLYIHMLSDSSDRVINAAANALGKTKSSKAYDVLVKLKDKPSWKSQSLISALNGFKHLNDKKATPIVLLALSDFTMPHWTLSTNTWDYPIAAVETAIALQLKKEAYSILSEKLHQSLKEDDINGTFYIMNLIQKLGLSRSIELIPYIKEKFNRNANCLATIKQYETAFSNFKN